MSFVYDNLWKLLEQRNMSKDELRNKIRASQTTIVNLGKNKNVSLDVINRICEVLDCTPNDIMEFVSENEPECTVFPKRGEIYFANFTFGEGSLDKSTSRPVVILQDDYYNKLLQTVLVAPISSRVSHNNMPTQIIIQSEEYNLKQDATILIHNMSIIRKIGLISKIGSLNQLDITRLENACKSLLGLK